MKAGVCQNAELDAAGVSQVSRVGRGSVAEGIVQALVVEPGDPLDDRQLQLQLQL